MEEWKSVVGYEGLYDVSSYGRVRSLPRKVRANFGIATRGGNVLSPVLVATGYRQVTLRDATRRPRKDVFVHTIVLEAFVGPPPIGHECCHYNGVRDDNRLENLRWDTCKGNVADQRRHGTMPIGERSYRALLTENQVREIKAALCTPYRGIVRALAREYGVGPSCISGIRHSKSWTYL